MTNASGVSFCTDCGAPLQPAVLACGACGFLIHSARLFELQAEAVEAGRRGESSEELRLWRASLDLLPPGTRQHAAVRARVDALSESLDRGEQAAAPPRRPDWFKKAPAAAGVARLLLWKFKSVALLLLTKGKLLLFGLTKISTFFLHAGFLRRLLGALRLDVRPGSGAVDLRPRNGPRLGGA
jgi:hypothetical protein